MLHSFDLLHNHIVEKEYLFIPWHKEDLVEECHYGCHLPYNRLYTHGGQLHTEGLPLHVEGTVSCHWQRPFPGLPSAARSDPHYSYTKHSQSE